MCVQRNIRSLSLDLSKMFLNSTQKVAEFFLALMRVLINCAMYLRIFLRGRCILYFFFCFCSKNVFIKLYNKVWIYCTIRYNQSRGNVSDCNFCWFSRELLMRLYYKPSRGFIGERDKTTCFLWKKVFSVYDANTIILAKCRIKLRLNWLRRISQVKFLSYFFRLCTFFSNFCKNTLPVSLPVSLAFLHIFISFFLFLFLSRVHHFVNYG